MIKAGYTDIDATVDVKSKEGARHARKMRLRAGVPAIALAALLLCGARVLLAGEGSVPVFRQAVPAPPFPPMVHPLSPTILWGNVQRPYPTGAFWTNFVVGEGDGPVGVLPYAVKCVSAGVQLSYGAARRVLQPFSITDPFETDIQVSSVEEYSAHAVHAFDSISVTMNFVVSNGGSYSVPLVKGSPFVTVIYSASTPVISSDLMVINDVSDLNLPDGVRGSLRLVSLGNYLKWLVYCSDAAPLKVSGEYPALFLTTESPVSGIVRVALVPLGNENESTATLINHLRTYPIGGEVQLEQQGSNALVEYKFQTKSIPVGSTDPLLMLALPHHVSLLQNRSPHLLGVSSYGPCLCMKGAMRAVSGRLWLLKYDLLDVGWHFDNNDLRSLTPALRIISTMLESDLNATQPENARDPYGFGKEISRMANLALVADFLKMPAERRIALSNIENQLEPWVFGTNNDYLVYDETWGGIISVDGLQNSQADFGNGWYNDHHFHYGYFIFAGAVLAHLQSESLNQKYIAFFDSLVGDVCNYQADDMYFPFARHKDLFDGHSWASGLFEQANGKSQESSSEAVHAYYGCYLYGLATGRAALSSSSYVLLSMEVQAARQYWHMPNSDIYDPQFAAKRMAGVVGSLSVTASTWFGDAPEYVHGINLLPVTAVTSHLFDPTFAEKQWPILYGRLTSIPKVEVSCEANSGCSALGMIGDCCPSAGGVNLACCSNGVPGNVMSGEFKALIYADQALIDKTAAWNYFVGMTESPGVGASRSNYLLWAASRPETMWNNMSLQDLKDLMGREIGNDSVRKSCSDNSACKAIGISSGSCCPNDAGQYLGCCPQSK